MDVKTLLSKGYFPKELPPPFSSQSFANAADQVTKRWKRASEPARKKFRESTCVKYSIPRINYSRRIISIPNPLHQHALVEVIAANWAQLVKFCKQSKLSASRPIVDSSGLRAVSTLKKFSEYKRAYVKDSFDRLFEIRTDIARFFPSIYTHSIAWAIHGKAAAKKNRGNRRALGNALDIAVRACQSNQTIGIPIGPDTSIVLSEIIGTAIDVMLKEKYQVNGYRFVDDYHLFCKTHAEAEHLLKYLQSCFAKFELDMNDAKTDIVKFPQPFESKWTIELSSFGFSRNAKRQRLQIGQFFSLLYQSCHEHPEESVVKYGIKVLHRCSLQKANWSYLESLLLKTVIAFPQTLPELFFYLESHRSYVDKTILRRALLEILRNHSDKGHSFEVCWVLWIAKFYQIRIPAKDIVPIIESQDVIPTIVAFDLYHSKLVSGKLDVRSIGPVLTEDSLLDDHWLLTYELLKKGWIRKKNNPLKASQYFKILQDLKVDFYDSSKRSISKKLISRRPTVRDLSKIPLEGGY